MTWKLYSVIHLSFPHSTNLAAMDALKSKHSWTVFILSISTDSERSFCYLKISVVAAIRRFLNGVLLSSKIWITLQHKDGHLPLEHMTVTRSSLSVCHLCKMSYTGNCTGIESILRWNLFLCLYCIEKYFFFSYTVSQIFLKLLGVVLSWCSLRHDLGVALYYF